MIPAAFDAMGDLSEYHKAGKLRIIATSGSKRSAALPDIPTMREEGFNVQGDAWFGVFAPAATPAPLLAKIGDAVTAIFNDPPVKEKLAALGLVVMPVTRAELADMIRRDSDVRAALIKSANIQAQ